MNHETSPLTGDITAAREGVARRTILQGVAWSVPAVAMMSVAPAYAASSAPGVHVTTPNNRVTASGASPVTVTVTDASGPVAGASVSLTGPSGSTFAPANGTTDSTGTFATTVDLGKPWTKPGSTTTLTAVSGNMNGTAAVTILGANALGWGKSKNNNGTTSDSVWAPVQMAQVFPSPVVELSFGWTFTLALLADGTVWSTGQNDSGQLGDGTTTARAGFAPIPGLTGAKQIGTGINSCWALLSDGTVRSWGTNAYGQLGDGTRTNALSPVTVSGLTGVTQIAAGNFNAYALTGDGSVYAWGLARGGRLGNGTTASDAPSSADALVPVKVSNLTGVVALSAGSFGGAAVTDTGSILCWGRNVYGAMGDGGSTDHLVPAAVPGITTATAAAVNSYTVRVLLSDGTVVGWGQNAYGELGIGNQNSQSSPVAVPNLTGVTKIGAVVSASYALSSDGTLRGTGANDLVGDGTQVGRVYMTPIPLPSGVTISSLTSQSNYGDAAGVVLATS